MAFYDEMAAVVAELLAPDALGQGTVQLVRVIPGAAGANPWDKVTPTTATETLRAAVRGVSKQFAGMPTDNAGGVVLATDLEVIAAVPSIPYKPGDRLTIDGAAVTVLRCDNIPAAGTPAAVRFIVRN